MHIKFDISNEKLDLYKKHSISAKWAIQNKSDALEATQKSGNMKRTQFELILT